MFFFQIHQFLHTTDMVNIRMGEQDGIYHGNPLVLEIRK